MGALTLIKGVGKLDIYQMIDGKRSDKLEESRFNYADLGVSPIYISPNPQTGGLNLHVVSHRWAGELDILKSKRREYERKTDVQWQHYQELLKKLEKEVKELDEKINDDV